VLWTADGRTHTDAQPTARALSQMRSHRLKALPSYPRPLAAEDELPPGVLAVRWRIGGNVARVEIPGLQREGYAKV